MDYMNLHQSAHGGREFGFAASRLRKSRHVIAGHWQDLEIQREFAAWARVARGWAESQTCRVARFGDNMRNVAVTEGDKVEAQIQLGWRVDGYGLDDLYRAMDEAQDQVPQIVEACLDEYNVAAELQKGASQHHALVESARIEAGIRHFLVQGNFSAFTTTFENLGNLPQLPGLAVQRLMKEGYGFGAEGDWKTAALLYIVKVIGLNQEGGASFIEDYTYHFGEEAACLGAHMLEVCPSITTEQPISVSSPGHRRQSRPCAFAFWCQSSG
ncbi:L-arabinose isomerase-like [Saccostrea echinata]|uniref:L-arabinose isomerase-like n=1 Tax=Saccostrea echinata TaxID=191078 RepID=UPI002A81A783|nr:L-arabinose isomerase-like [Saccostrea echinata]